MKVLIKLLSPILNGVVFGVSAVIPGVSGGTMMVVFGCYDKICGAMALDFKHIKKNFTFLALFAFGAALGVVGFSFLAKELFEHYPAPTYLFFLGLIVGSLPLIAKKLLSNDNQGGGFKLYYLIFTLFALALVILLSLLSGDNLTDSVNPAGDGTNANNPFLLVVFSAVAAMAMIIPGLSGSFILILLGVYPALLDAVTEFNLLVLIPAGLGIIVGIIFGAKLIKWLLSRFHSIVYSIIAGLILGSVYAIFPSELAFNPTLIFGICAFVLGAVITLVIGKTEKPEK